VIFQADARALPLRAGSVHCVVTSPPYWGLRDYGQADQIGLEPTPEAYVATLVAVFREVRRVLREDGTVWLNLGDSYAAGKQGRDDNTGADLERRAATYGTGTGNGRGPTNGIARYAPLGLKPKDLVGIPWRVAFALQADGWFLRADIIWAKPNPMPESVTDRPTKAHEYVFLLAKSERYYYDAEAIKERFADERNGGGGHYWRELTLPNRPGPISHTGLQRGFWNENGQHSGRNRRSVWEIAAQPYPEAHFATFPEALVEPCVLAGTSERGGCPACGMPWRRKWTHGDVISTGGSENGRRPSGNAVTDFRGGAMNCGAFPAREHLPAGWQPGCACGLESARPVVLDPFAGSGTVGEVCARLGRRFVGLDLSAPYTRLAYRRTAQLNLL